MREILFHRNDGGSCPVEEFLDGLGPKQAQKVAWVLKLIKELPLVPGQYLKKLEGTDNRGSRGVWWRCVPIIGLFGIGQPDHFDQRICEENTKNARPGNRTCGATQARLLEAEDKTMKDDLDKYISRRKSADKKFAEKFDGGY